MDLKRSLQGIAALAAAALVLSGCASGGASAETESARQEAAFAGVYAQAVEWGECGDAHGLTDEFSAALEESGSRVDRFECAWVEAPLDWDDPESAETIQLAVTRIPATGKRIGALFGNPGGPGGSGLDYTFDATAGAGIAAIMEQYDLIGFDPRGIGKSSPVECDDVSDIFEIQIAVCADQNPLAHSMGTSQVARDMELLRHLVDDDRFNYLGYSYGTMLGATYATLFPEKAGRMVLDSAAAAGWASLIGSFNQSAAIAQQVVEMFAGCGEEYEVASCPISAEDQYIDTIERLNETPWVASDGTEVNGAVLQGYLTSALYSRNAGRAEALDTVSRALAGEQSQIDDIARRMADGGAAVDLGGMIVRCHSFPDDPDIVGLLEHVEEAGIPKLLGGPEITDDALGQFTELGCDALPESGDDITDTFSGSPDSPILVIGITGDHATPYSGAQQLVAELGNARLLTLEGRGHGASFMDRSDCVDGATTAYLLEGELPEEGAVCTDDRG